MVNTNESLIDGSIRNDRKRKIFIVFSHPPCSETERVKRALLTFDSDFSRILYSTILAKAHYVSSFAKHEETPS